VQIRSIAYPSDFHFAGVNPRPWQNEEVVIWNLNELDEHDRGAISAVLKSKLGEHLLATPGRAFIVDEAVA